MAKRQKVSTRFEAPESGKTYKAKRLTPDSIKTESSPAGLDFSYTTGGKRCKVDRLKDGRCASQLVFHKGQTMLQLCEGYLKPGDMLPVKDAQDAQQKADKHCVTQRGLGDHAPGAAPQKMHRGNPAWIAAGVAVGVMAAVLIKKRQAAPAA